MALNVGSQEFQGKSWNYTRPNDPGYSLSITGTVVSLQEVQRTEFRDDGQPGAPMFFKNGDPKFKIRMGMALPDGSLGLVYVSEAWGKQVKREIPSLHMDLIDLGGGDIKNIIGKTITVWTEEPPVVNGRVIGFGVSNPRPYHVKEEPELPHYTLSQPLDPIYLVEKLLANGAAAGGQVVPPAQPQVPQQQPVQTQPQQVTQSVVQQPTMQQPAVQQPVQQAPHQPVQAQPTMPQGMDPAVAAAMQQLGATNVQPMQPQFSQQQGSIQGSVYDEDIPF